VSRSPSKAYDSMSRIRPASAMGPFFCGVEKGLLRLLKSKSLFFDGKKRLRKMMGVRFLGGKSTFLLTGY